MPLTGAMGMAGDSQGGALDPDVFGGAERDGLERAGGICAAARGKAAPVGHEQVGHLVGNARYGVKGEPADLLVAMVVVDSCYHAATTLSRSRVIYPYHRSVMIVGIACA